MVVIGVMPAAEATVMIFGLVLVVVLVAVFTIGLLKPELSRRAQEGIKAVADRVVKRVRSRPGEATDRAADVVDMGVRAAEESAHSGRRVHDTVFDSGRGERQDDVLERRYGEGAERGREDAEDASRTDDNSP